MATDLPVTYRQSPRPVGFPVTYKLLSERLVIDSTRRVDEVTLRHVELVRLTYEPGKLARGFFKMALRFTDGRTLAITSVSWASLMQMRDQRPAYGAFVRALTEAIGRANPQARFEAGKPRLLWGAMALLACLVVAVLAILIARSLAAGSFAAAVVALGLGAAMLWQVAPMVRLNRPRPFAPGEVPADLVG